MTRSKVAVTDELLDAYVNRPLAGYVVRAVERTQITPNQLTLMSGLCGTAAAVALMSPFAFAPLAAAVCLLLSMIFDCSDGQLARLRGGGSVSGRIFDGYVDYWVAILLHAGMLISLGRSGVVAFGHTFSALERLLLVLAAGISMGINAGRFDHYKLRYLAHTGAARDPENPQMFLDEAKRSRWLIVKAALHLFAAYVRVQQGPEFRKRVAAAKWTAADPTRVRIFAEENGPLVRLWGLTGPTMHNGAIVAFACLAPFVPQAFAWYCAFALVAVNVYCFVLRILQARALRRELTESSGSGSAGGDSGVHA